MDRPEKREYCSPPRGGVATRHTMATLPCGVLRACVRCVLCVLRDEEGKGYGGAERGRARNGHGGSEGQTGRDGTGFSFRWMSLLLLAAAAAAVVVEV